jgi:putative membrane protein
MLVGAAALGACKRGDTAADSAATAPARTTTDTSGGGTAPSGAAMADSTQSGANGGSANLSAANIASLVGLTNASEIGQAKVAQEKATSADVKAFAKLMISDHEAMQKSLDSLAKQKNLTPTPPQQADAQRQQDSQTMSTLNGAAKGPAFDKAYIDAQVAAHRQALSNLQSFAGATSDPDLKALLQQAIPKVQSHLDKAQQLQSKEGTGNP